MQYVFHVLLSVFLENAWCLFVVGVYFFVRVSRVCPVCLVLCFSFLYRSGSCSLMFVVGSPLICSVVHIRLFRLSPSQSLSSGSLGDVAGRRRVSLVLLLLSRAPHRSLRCLAACSSLPLSSDFLVLIAGLCVSWSLCLHDFLFCGVGALRVEALGDDSLLYCISPFLSFAGVVFLWGQHPKYCCFSVTLSASVRVSHAARPCFCPFCGHRLA